MADADLVRAGTQGYVSAEEANKLTAERGAAPSDVLFDPKGDVGRAYGAQTTPHMYVIKGDGTLAFMGGIDDKPTTRLDDLKTAKNFVDAALNEVAAGRPVSVTTSRPTAAPSSIRPERTRVEPDVL